MAFDVRKIKIIITIEVLIKEILHTIAMREIWGLEIGNGRANLVSRMRIQFSKEQYNLFCHQNFKRYTKDPFRVSC